MLHIRHHLLPNSKNRRASAQAGMRLSLIAVVIPATAGYGIYRVVAAEGSGADGAGASTSVVAITLQDGTIVTEKTPSFQPWR
jgi:hypothetical protein